MREEKQKKYSEIIEALELYGWKKTRSYESREWGGHEFYEHDGLKAKVAIFLYNDMTKKADIVISVNPYFSYSDLIENVNIGYKEVADKEGTRKVVPVYLQFGDGMRYDARLFLQDGSVELYYNPK